MGYCCGRSLWTRLNFTLVVSEKFSLICCGQSTLIHTTTAWAYPWEKDIPMSENLESWGQNIGFKIPCWYEQSSLCLETVLSFLAFQGKKRARDLKIVRGNLGKPRVPKNRHFKLLDYSVLTLSKLLLLISYCFTSFIESSVPTLPTNTARATKSPRQHLAFPRVFQRPSERDAPDNQRPLVLQNFNTLENLSPASHAPPKKSATPYSGWEISKGSSTFTEHTRKKDWVTRSEGALLLWEAKILLFSLQLFALTSWTEWQSPVAFVLRPNTRIRMMFSLKKHLQWVPRRKFSKVLWQI